MPWPSFVLHDSARQGQLLSPHWPAAWRDGLCSESWGRSVSPASGPPFCASGVAVGARVRASAAM
eukprot:888263-Pyramimonas_sp.AAC.1